MEAQRVCHLSNEQLLARYQQGDAVAFDEFFKRSHKVIYNFLLSRLKVQSDAEDALQQSFLKLHRYILSYDPRQNALSWALTIARNVMSDVRSARLSLEGRRT